MSTLLLQKNLTNEGNIGNQVCKLDVGMMFLGLHVINQDPANPIDINDLVSMSYDINGTEYIPATMDGPTWDQINQWDGIEAFDGQDFFIPFTLEGMKDQRLRELTAVNTGQSGPSGKEITNHTLRLKWATAVDVLVYAECVPSTPDGPGIVRRFTPYDKTSTKSRTKFSDFDYAEPEFAFWRRIFTKASAGTVAEQQLSAPKAMLWGEQIPTVAAMHMAVAGGHVDNGYWDYVMDFTARNDGYTAVPRVLADGTIVADTPHNPMLDTMPYKKVTMSLTSWNTVGGTNSFWLESAGQIE